jgi:hypothetical protein
MSRIQWHSGLLQISFTVSECSLPLYLQNRGLKIQYTEKVKFIENISVLHIRQSIRKLENYLSTQTISDFNEISRINS